MVFGTGMTNQAVNAGELAHGTTHPHPEHLIAKRGNAHKAIHGLKYTCRLEFGPLSMRVIRSGTEHVAHPRGPARILEIESVGSI